MLPKKYMGPIRNLGTSALAVVIAGFVLPFILPIFLTESQMEGVLIQALPFLGVFIAIILLFILLIFMVVIRFSGKLPYRTHRPVEVLSIFGIFTGIFFLFQPWQLVAYQYSFMWLLMSTLWFIMWSHVSPRAGAVEQEYPPYSTAFWGIVAAIVLLTIVFTRIEFGAYLVFTAYMVYILLTYWQPVRTSSDTDVSAISMKHHAIGVLVGLIAASIVAVTILTATIPREPYGYSQRQWDRGLRDEQKQEVILAANATYRQFTIPFAIFMSLFPGSLVFFLSREIAASAENEPAREMVQSSHVASMPGS